MLREKPSLGNDADQGGDQPDQKGRQEESPPVTSLL
jgi:hypothetical protein